MRLRLLRPFHLAAALSLGVGVAVRAETTPVSADDGVVVKALPPFWDAVYDEEGRLVSSSVLYPLWHTERYPEAESRSWSVLSLINHERNDATGVTRLDAWPLYFSRQTDTEDPATDYRAVFPLYGDIPQRFGQDQLQFALFPLYGRFEKGGVVTTTTPWPFIKTVTGDVQHGFELWPVGGHRAALDGNYAESFAIWPLYYRKRTGPAEEPTSLQAGLLPLYALDHSEGYVSETYLWPFFGYVDRTEPYRYHATHYLWPLWVQGRGEDRTINRWAPFYTHSEIRGTKKTWLLWPLWRDATWRDRKLEHHRRQFLYFVYHSTVQTSLHHPGLAPASKTHLWPLFSAWDNGAGREQIQVLSPIEVFLPHNERTRRLWSSLFALYRYDRDASRDQVEHRLLWGLLKWTRQPQRQANAVSLGPLVSFRNAPDSRRLSFLGDRFGLDFDGSDRAAAQAPSLQSAPTP